MALILDEPTRGVDVGAKMEIYRIIRQLAAEGLGILMISSELPEVIGLCDRVVVMCEGRKTGELAGAQITEEALLKLAVASGRGADRAGRPEAA
jgi:ABC-type sugar transport system ATPase subunit